MAPLAWVIQEVVGVVNQIMAKGQSGGGGSLSMGHSEGNAMYGSSSSVTGK